MNFQPSKHGDSIFKLLDESSLDTKHFKEYQIDISGIGDSKKDSYYLDIIHKKKNMTFIKNICKIYECNDTDLITNPSNMSIGRIDLLAGGYIVDLKCYGKDKILTDSNVAQIYSYYASITDSNGLECCSSYIQMLLGP
jgi:hypothetical protein